MNGLHTESLGIQHHFVNWVGLLLILLLVSANLRAEVMPSWITSGKLSDASNYFVVCSHDGIDPDEARQIAESKCIGSAAKLSGVNVRITQKTVQSLTGSDSSEVAEIQPLHANVQCNWTDRYLETINDLPPKKRTQKSCSARQFFVIDWAHVAQG